MIIVSLLKTAWPLYNVNVKRGSVVWKCNVYYKCPHISRYFRKYTALSEKLPILAAPLQYAGSLQ